MWFLPLLGLATQVASGLGAFDWAASRASRLVGGPKDRRKEPLVVPPPSPMAKPQPLATPATPSTTLILSRIEFLFGAILAGTSALEPHLIKINDGENLGVIGITLMVVAFVKAVQRYRTTHAVAG